MPGSERYTFNLFAFTLFLFIFISNQIGLFIEVDIGKDTWFRSATASPVITMTLAMMVLVLSHYFGVVFKGFKGYLKGYASPVAILLPINLLEEFTNFITLSMRLYGNIFAGEVLVLLIRQFAFSGGAVSFVSGFLRFCGKGSQSSLVVFKRTFLSRLGWFTHHTKLCPSN